jgi:DNA-binding NtrC family response regulator
MRGIWVTSTTRAPLGVRDAWVVPVAHQLVNGSENGATFAPARAIGSKTGATTHGGRDGREGEATAKEGRVREEAAGPRGFARVLIVDDDPLIRLALRHRLEADGHRVAEASDGDQLRERLGEEVFDLVLLDDRLPGTRGLGLLEDLCTTEPDVPVIMLTGHANVGDAVEAMRLGAYWYAAKPVDFERLSVLVLRALETNQLRRELRRLRVAQSRAPSLSSIIGESAVMRELKGFVARIATSPASTVLLLGESGTGKDLVARAIHRLSARCDGPFTNITCSALPATLLESELFGHERGAFTDAKTRKLGLVEDAEGGTLFLDEIGEMEPLLQAKLLRFLESKVFRRVGGTADVHADVRVIAATNRDLREAVKQGTFRQDLYYRLAVLTVHLPPLRERSGDIELLAAQLVERFNAEFGRRAVRLSPTALERLRTYSWPGNVRELRNALERAVLLCEGPVLEAGDFTGIGEVAVQDASFSLPAAGLDIRELERSLVLQALQRTGWNQTRAAALLGMNRDQIRYRIELFGLARTRSARAS